MSELRVTRRWVVVIATWLVAATVSPGLAHAEPSETWNGSISYDPDGARTIGTFTVDVAPDGVAAGQGMGEWTGLGTMDPMGIEVTGRRTPDGLDLSISASGLGGSWRLDHVFPVIGAESHASLNQDAPPGTYPRWSVDMTCDGC